MFLCFLKMWFLKLRGFQILFHSAKEGVHGFAFKLKPSFFSGKAISIFCSVFFSLIGLWLPWSLDLVTSLSFIFSTLRLFFSDFSVSVTFFYFWVLLFLFLVFFSLIKSTFYSIIGSSTTSGLANLYSSISS